MSETERRAAVRALRRAAKAAADTEAKYARISDVALWLHGIADAYEREDA